MANRAASNGARKETAEEVIDQDVDGRNLVAEEPEEVQDRESIEEGGGEGEDARLIGGESGQEGDDPAEEGLTEEEITARRQAIRDKRKRKKEAQRRRISDDRAELDSLRRSNSDMARRLALVENRSVSADMATVDTKITEAKRYTEEARRLYRVALASEDPEERAKAADLEEAIYNGRAAMARLTEYKAQAERSASAPAPTNEAVRSLASDWASKNTWYDPSGGDRDSRVMAQLDRDLASEMDPSDPRYWRELTKLGKQYLPHRYKAAGDEHEEPEPEIEEDAETPRRPMNGRRRGGPPMGGSGDGDGGGGQPDDFRLSVNRREALRDAGIEPGTQHWKRMIAKYKAHDAQQQRRT